MIDFVAKRAGQQAFGAHFVFLSGHVLRAHGHIFGPQHVSAKSRDGQTALFLALFAFGANNFRVGEHQLCFRILPHGYVDYRYAQAQANLRRGQSHTLRSVHRLEHVFGELRQLRVEFVDRLRGLLEHCGWEFRYWVDHRLCASFLCAVLDAVSCAKIRPIAFDSPENSGAFLPANLRRISQEMIRRAHIRPSLPLSRQPPAPRKYRNVRTPL